MLTIPGSRQAADCDGQSRRNFLRIGALGMGGLSLPEMLRAEASGGDRKAVIMVFLAGGPSHQDMVDLKEDAPQEIRGSFSAINTSVPGIRICEHLPRMAANMDKFAIIRSLADAVNQHSSYQCETSRSNRKDSPMPSGGWPAIGSVLARYKDPIDGVPPFTALNSSRAKGGFLGTAYNPFNPRGRGRGDLSLNGVSLDRMDDRRGLLASFDRFRRDVDRSGTMEGLDAFNRQAFEVITSSRLAKALDLKNEDPKVIERYRARAKGTNLDSFLLARRLVEAGSRCVTLSFGGWDTHNDNFKKLSTQLPQLDHGLTCLVEDLHASGLDRDVSVIVWGEFGRTPKVNSKGGRDHWNKSSMAILAGGGMNTGQVIGATDRHGAAPADRPVHYGDIFATLYKNCGLDPEKLVGTDFTGRPHYLVDPHFGPIEELG